MQQLVLILHVLVAIAIVALVLMQHGKGADIGAAFGSGASQTMFGSIGSMSFLMKLTAFLGAVFFATSLGLNYLASHAEKQSLDATRFKGQLTSLPVKTDMDTKQQKKHTV